MRNMSEEMQKQINYGWEEVLVECGNNTRNMVVRRIVSVNGEVDVP